MRTCVNCFPDRPRDHKSAQRASRTGVEASADRRRRDHVDRQSSRPRPVSVEGSDRRSSVSHKSKPTSTEKRSKSAIKETATAPPSQPTAAADATAESGPCLSVVKAEPVEIKMEPGAEAVNDCPAVDAVVVKRERDEPLEEGECTSSDGE